MGGAELANAYQEETSSNNLRSRFEKENKLRIQLGKETIPLDDNFLNAMKEGFPKCSGIALGVDRLLMLQLEKSDIAEVLFLK